MRRRHNYAVLMSDPKKLIKKAKGQEKEQYTVYLPQNVWEDFKQLCESAKASSNRLLEEILKDFLKRAAEGRRATIDAAKDGISDGEEEFEGVDLKPR